jgi:hypothetical protein
MFWTPIEATVFKGSGLAYAGFGHVNHFRTYRITIGDQITWYGQKTELTLNECRDLLKGKGVKSTDNASVSGVKGEICNQYNL